MATGPEIAAAVTYAVDRNPSPLPKTPGDVTRGTLCPQRAQGGLDSRSIPLCPPARAVAVA